MEEPNKHFLKAQVHPDLKKEFEFLWRSKGFVTEADYLRSLARDQVIKHRTPVELIRLTKVLCEAHIQLKLNGFVEYEGKEVKDVFGCINEVKNPIL